MSEPFLAEVRIMGFNFPPRGWATCDGQILPINQNQSLFSLLGTSFGGDGRTTFALPDLRGRSPGTSAEDPAGTAEQRRIHFLPARSLPIVTASGVPPTRRISRNRLMLCKERRQAADAR